MNERIKELKKQATKTLKADWDCPEDLEEFDADLFAELIIQECIHLCAETEASYSLIRRVTSDFSEKNIFAEGEVAARVVATKIKQHFAVE